MESMQTEHFELILSQCESREEYEQLVREHQSLYVDWQEHLSPMTQERRLNYKMIAQGCEVSETSARSFLKKIPAKRENVIMLAMMMHLTVDETNELLMRWAKFQRLYSRNPNDAIWIYLLEKGGSDEPRKLYRAYNAAYEEIRDEYKASKFTVCDAQETNILLDEIQEQARHAADRSHDARVEDLIDTFRRGFDPACEQRGDVDPEFRELMKKSMPSFEKGYQKLLNYIDSFFYDLEIEDNRRLRLESSNAARDRMTPNKRFQDDKSWKDTYYRKIRALERKQVMPCRAFLIALGLRLGMNTDQLNTLLDLAGMGPLCPKDKLEGTVVFYLEDLSCNFPSYFNEPANISVSMEYELMDYSSKLEKERRKRDADVRDLFAIPDIAMDYEDNPVECLNDYIKRSVLGTNIFEFGYDDYITELLEML